MSFPFTYRQTFNSNHPVELVENAGMLIPLLFLKKLNPHFVQDWQQNENEISFVSQNSLFRINTPIQFNWSVSSKIQLDISFDMSNFMRWLSIIAIVVGLLGKISFQHYLIVTGFTILSLYAINFYILKVYTKRLLNDVFTEICPTKSGIDQENNRDDYFSDYSTSKGEQTIKYEISNKKS